MTKKNRSRALQVLLGTSILLLSAVYNCAFAQIPTFEKKYGGSGDEYGFHIIEIPGSGYLVAGSTTSSGSGGSDACLIRLDNNGNILWQRTYGGPADEKFYLVTRGNDGGFLAVGETGSTGQGGQDILMVKTDDNGNVIWSKTMGGSFDDYASISDEIINLPDGYLISGDQTSYANGTPYASYFIRMDNAGNIVWRHGYVSSNWNYFVCTYVEGNTAYLGGTAETDGFFGKMDLQTGDIVFGELISGNSNETLYNIRPTKDGNLLMSQGTWSATNGSEQRQWLVKTDKNGGQIWSKIYFVPGFNMQGPAIVAKDGGFLLLPMVSPITNPNGDGFMAKTDSAGNILWAYRFGGSHADRFIHGLQTADGGYIAVGNTQNDNGSVDIFVVKTDENGLVSGCCKRPFNLQSETFNLPTSPVNFSLNNFAPAVNWSVPKLTANLNAADACTVAQPQATHIIDLLPNATFTVNGIAYTAPDTITVQKPATPCDSLITYILHLLPITPIEFQIVDPTCTAPNSGQITVLNQPSATFSLNNGFFQSNPVFANLGPNQYTLVVHDNNTGFNQDTVVVLIQLAAPTFTSQDVIICPNSSVTIHGIVYTQPGTVIDTLPGPGGCDTIATYHLIRGLNPKVTHTVAFCPGTSVVINGITYTKADTAFTYTIPGATGCDTLVTYFLQYPPQPSTDKTIRFCPGKSVVVEGNTYSQPGTVHGVLHATTGCDTLVTYHLEYAPQPATDKTVRFCPGKSVVIDGNTYSQPGTVHGVLHATTGCDTLATYHLEYAPQPTRSQTIEFCKGSSVTLGGLTYTHPGTVTLTLPAAIGCDTLATYILKYVAPANPTSISMNCPNDIFVNIDAGDTIAVVNYAIPTATTDCPCPGVAVQLEQGLASGSAFHLGATTVCYNAKDSCGGLNTCCFKVTVQENPPCDIKEIACVKFELLSITEDPQQRKTYRIRTTNHCSNRMIYMLVENPNGLVAYLPHDNTTFTTPGGRTYEVRNPNFSPFYSVRFSSLSDSIHNGKSDIFKYTLPAQADPDYIHVEVKLEPDVYYEAYLNTFYCPVVSSPNHKAARDSSPGTLALFPNPTNGALFADLSAWNEQNLTVTIVNAEGQVVQRLNIKAGPQSQQIDLLPSLTDGLYLFMIKTNSGAVVSQKFVIQH